MPRAVCDICGQKPRGPLSYLYPRLLTGTLVYYKRHRLCDLCFGLWVRTVCNDLPPAAMPEDREHSTACFVCGSVFMDGYRGDSFYLSIFKTGNDEAYLYGETCPSCSTRLVERAALLPEG